MVGDPDPPGERQVYVNLTCNPSATTLQVTQFVQAQASGHVANTPYVYYIVLPTAATCGATGLQSNCPIFLFFF